MLRDSRVIHLFLMRALFVTLHRCTAADQPLLCAACSKALPQFHGLSTLTPGLLRARLGAGVVLEPAVTVALQPLDALGKVTRDLKSAVPLLLVIATCGAAEKPEVGRFVVHWTVTDAPATTAPVVFFTVTVVLQ
jgi:hypothetical protein